MNSGLSNCSSNKETVAFQCENKESNNCSLSNFAPASPKGEAKENNNRTALRKKLQQNKDSEKAKANAIQE